MSEVQEIIGGKGSWVYASKNTDEDIHFSELYRRADRELGYRNSLYFYSCFNEEYYFQETEHNYVQQKVLKRITRDGDYFVKLILGIITQSKIVGVFYQEQNIDELIERDQFNSVIDVYRKNMVLHYSLYKKSRMVEAVDRLNELLTNQLDLIKIDEESRKILNQRVAQILKPELEFENQYQKLFFEIKDSLGCISSHVDTVEKLSMILSPRICLAVDNYVSKWRHVYYHGYRARYDACAYHVRQRILRDLQQKEFITNYQHEVNKLDRVLDKHVSDSNPIARILEEMKIFRRLSQLKNFEKLDNVLKYFSRKICCTEWQLRCLRPNEVLMLVRGQRRHLITADKRASGVVLGWLDGKPFELVGTEAHELKKFLASSVSSETNIGSNFITGRSACGGIVSGVARVVKNRSDLAKVQNGDVMFCSETDPDYYPFIILSAAVVTSRGGVTSHTASLCRELNKPCIIGVGKFPEWLKNGERVVVDADAGKVTPE